MKYARVSLKFLLSVVLASVVLPALASDDDGGQGDISYSHISIFGHVGEGVFDADFKGGIVRGSYGFGDHFSAEGSLLGLMKDKQLTYSI